MEVPLDRLELSLLAPEANALSTELQGHEEILFYHGLFPPYFACQQPEYHTEIWGLMLPSSIRIRSISD